MLEAIPFIQHLPYLGLLILFVLGVLGFPFPEDGILVLSGLLTARRIIEPIPAFLVVYCSVMVTDFFLYSVGRKYGRRLIEHKRLQRILRPERFSKLEKRFKHSGSGVVFLGRLFPGLRAQIFLVAGMLRMSRTTFLVADGSSVLFTVTLWGGMGYLGGNNIETLKKNVSQIEQIAILLLLVFAGRMVFQYFKARRGKEVRPLSPEPPE